ncbi:MAG: AsmA family protein [Desulfobacteraceae bacterium]|jgi:hypothetical protein
MARPLKWIFGIIGGVIALAIVAVVIILFSYDFNDLKPVISKAVYDATGRELVIDSDIDLDIGFSPSLVLSGIKFQNAGWGSRKEMVKVGRFEVKVALLPLIKGNIEVNRFILKDTDILIETDKKGKANFEFETAGKAPVTEKIPAAESKPVDTGEKTVELPPLTINEFEIINGTLTYRDGKTGKSEIVKLKNLIAAVQGLDNPFSFELEGSYNDAPFDVSGILGSIKAINDPDIIWPVELAVKAFGVNSNIKGSIKNPVEQQGIKLDFNVKIDDWNKLSKIAGQEIPIKDALSVSGNIADSAPKSYQISALKIALGKNQIEGSIGANLTGKVPFIDASLSSKELDLKTLMPKEDKAPVKDTEKKEQVPAKESDRMFPDDPLPLDSLKIVDGRFKIRFDRVIIQQMVIDNLVLDSIMNKGTLSVKPLKAKIGGGDVSLNLNLASKDSGADLSTVINVRGFKIAKMLADAGSTEIIEGSIDADIDIKGRGKSVASIMAGLNGYSRIIMGEGKIDNKIIDKLGGDMSKNILRLLNPSIDQRKYTTLKCMVTRFDILDGIADATAFVFNTSMMNVIGEGNINLKSEKLNLSLDPSTKGGVAGYSLNIGELSQPFKLGGTLVKPSLVLDKQKTVSSIGKLLGKKLLKDKSGSQEKDSGQSSEVDLCAAALQAAETGVKMTAEKESATQEEAAQVTPKKIIEDAKKDPEKLIDDIVKDPKKALKSLFGR